jgi:hypothetical protein
MKLQLDREIRKSLAIGFILIAVGLTIYCAPKGIRTKTLNKSLIALRETAASGI